MVKNIYINERLPPKKAMLKSRADHRKIVLTRNDRAVLVLCDCEKGVQMFMSVTCERNVETPKNPVKRNPTASASSRKSVVNPFKSNFFDVLYIGENFTKAFVSPSPHQRKALKDAVFWSLKLVTYSMSWNLFRNFMLCFKASLQSQK